MFCVSFALQFQLQVISKGKFVFTIANEADVHTFLLEHSLYEECEVGLDPSDDYGPSPGVPDSPVPPGTYNVSKTLDCFCLTCKRPSVFVATIYQGYAYTLINGADVEFLCTRCNHQKLIFHLKNNEDGHPKIQKIGQYPSLATLQMQGVTKYVKVLGSIDFEELKKAIGLHAHGIGIGAFVYLRRIIERLVAKCRDDAVTTGDMKDDDEFDQKRMNEKIEILKNHLPEFVFEQRNTIYAILSKGIHESTEDECKTNFPVLRASIEIILDEVIYKKEQKAKRDLVSKTLPEIKNS
jgi:hypothetical protein